VRLAEAYGELEFVPVSYFVIQIASGNRFLTLALEIVALSTANDLVKLQNVVSHTDQRPLPAYFLQPA
jgi:hypothetical protein